MTFVVAWDRLIHAVDMIVIRKETIFPQQAFCPSLNNIYSYNIYLYPVKYVFITTALYISHK